MGHIELGRWADTIVVAPASADFIARLAAGLASDLLSTVCLATSAPVILAPAMNQSMWQKPTTQRNLATLRADGITLLGPADGLQACGDTGPGRMLEPDELIEYLSNSPNPGPLENIRVMVTAGPTWEALDPVRGLSNHSSGKMGYAVANAAKLAGASVSLISGPVTITPPTGVELKNVTTAKEMLSAVESGVSGFDIFIGVAAVVDYRPAQVASTKMKKDAQTLTVEFVRNPDILSTVTQQPDPPFTVGFAAETDQPLEHAREKLKNKRLDLIAVNQVGGDNNPFGSDHNTLTLISQHDQVDLGLDSKTELARRLVEEIAGRYHAKNPA
jgi:phosphopantothenoylcysteine decarboxylase/phosphopantothenate--cysteine ligase